MKIPLSWLKEYVDIDITAQELMEKLFSCGFEVEELIDLSSEISNVVVGKIESVQKQEGTDHLQICTLNCGEYGDSIVISTGAPNAILGAKVPVALDGATLPGGFKIKARNLKGVLSNGMLCSGEELGINNDYYEGAETKGLLILNDEEELGQDICEVIGLKDYILDISITANRPDCQSVFGMAREISALLDKPLKMPQTSFNTVEEKNSGISVSVESKDVCPRYLAHYVKNIRIAPSPQWLKRRLALCGLRSINNIVDITNHSLLEIGQPMHAFDLSKISGKSIIVRRAKDGELITTLDEKQFKLTSDNLAICDENGPVAIAGVMGGLQSAMTDNSKDLLFECASFARHSVRKTSRALGQISDSSLRYEKGVDEYSTELGLKRALHLIDALNCGDVTNVSFDCDAGAQKERRIIKASTAQINSVLGIEVPKQAVCDILKRLDFGVEEQGETLIVSVPRYREDVQDFPDLAEEVIRMYGYHHIVPTFLQSAKITKGGLSHYQNQELKAKRVLCAQGYFEAITLAFCSMADLKRLNFSDDAKELNAVRLQNPLTEHLSLMRTSIVPSLLKVVEDNLKKGNAKARFFELGNVYFPANNSGEKPQEIPTLCLAAFGEQEDFFTVKGTLQALAEAFSMSFSYERASESYLHGGISANIILNGEVIGCFGKLSNEIAANLELPKDQKQGRDIYFAQVNFEKFIAMAPKGIKYKPLSRFAPQKRDLALICDTNITCGEIEDVIYKASPLVSSVELFDVYTGDNIEKGKMSMAFSVTLYSQEEITLKVADKTVQKLLGDLKHKLNITLR